MDLSAPPPLIVITDTRRAPATDWLARIGILCERARPGSVLVQLRDRELTTDERLAFGQRLRALTRAHEQLLAVNDRLDLAAVLEADAVHLPEAGVDVATARAFLARYRASWFVSVACHDPRDVASTQADAVLLSPILEARKGHAALGRRGIERAREAASGGSGARRCWVYALGGITAAAVSELRTAGADGVAVIGAALERGAHEALLSALGITR